MRNNVTFRHPAEFVGDEGGDGGILVVAGAAWFADLLSRVPGLQIEPELCQEDWGVVAFAERNQKRFWIGLSFYDEGVWIAHFHHASFAWLQRLSMSGNEELRKLITDFHHVLANERAVSEITWYEERETWVANAQGSPTPD
jgi:hypothetical protein